MAKSQTIETTPGGAPLLPEVETTCRALYVQLESELPMGQPLVLGVTSPHRGAGRTTIAMGMAAAAAAQIGAHARVLLVDGDLENPRLHELYGVPGSPGLAEMVADGIPLEEATVPVAPAIRLLPAGGGQPNLPRLFRRLEEREFFAELGGSCDALIVDLPPVQTAGLGAMPPLLVPQLCLVVRAGTTRRDEMQHALAAFPTGRITAVLLNEQKQRLPRWLDLILN